MLYTKTGFRLSFLPLFGMIPISDTSPEHAVNDVIAQEARDMGGDAVIKLKIQWDPPSDGNLGLGAQGGSLVVKGTVIKRSSSDTAISIAGKEPNEAIETIPQQPNRRYDTPNFFEILFQGTPAHSPSLTYANVSGAGGGGIRFGYPIRRRDAKFAFTPAISYGTHTNTVKHQFSERIFNPNTRQFELVEFEAKQSSQFKLIPIELNVAANLAAFPEIAEGLPGGLNPYVETGLTYYFWRFSYAQQNSYNNFSYSFDDWNYFDIGMNVGVGAEYALKPGLAVWGGLKRYFVFTEGAIQTWNVQMGVSLYK